MSNLKTLHTIKTEAVEHLKKFYQDESVIGRSELKEFLLHELELAVRVAEEDFIKSIKYAPHRNYCSKGPSGDRDCTCGVRKAKEFLIKKISDFLK